MSYNSYNTSASSARRPSRTSSYATTPRASSTRDHSSYSNPSFSTTFRSSNSGVGGANPGTTHMSPSYTTTIPIQSVNTNGNSNGFHSHNNNNHSHR